MKKIASVLAVCLCFVFVIQSMPAEQVQYIAMEDVLLSEDIDVEFAENQIESIQQYRSLLDGFNKEVKMRNVDRQIYDENYGGAYIDEDGKLVVLLVKNDEQGVASIKDYTGNESIKIETCEYSFNEMLDVINIINDNLECLLDMGICITEMYEDVYANKVKIGVYELNEAKESELKILVDSSCVEIYNTNSFSHVNSAVYVKGGEKISRLGDGEDSSIGFGATRNGKDGIVIAGHTVEYIDQIFFYNDTAVGQVKANALSMFCDADAAFVENVGLVYTTNLIGEVAICHNTATSISDYPVGAMVYKYGQKTNLTGGVIVSNFHTSVYDEDWNDEPDHWVQNQTTAEYYSEGGDSGGPVFLIEGMYNGKYTCKLLGIHSGSYSGNAVFSKYYKIVEALNVQAKTY